MADQEILEIQQGIWIDERWLRSAGLGLHVQVMVQPGEIRIVAAPEQVERPTGSKGWDVFKSLGNDAQPGRLPNASEDHDKYLYGDGE